jgi:hypothetical protein
MTLLYEMKLFLNRWNGGYQKIQLLSIFISKIYIGLRKKCTQQSFVQKTDFSGTELMTIFPYPPPPSLRFFLPVHHLLVKQL